MISKDKKIRKPVDIRRKVYQTLVLVLLGLISLVTISACWYALYVNLMPAVNSFMFGYAGGATAFEQISDEVLPYTMTALWAIPTLLLCATLNVLWWKATKMFIRGLKRVYRFMIDKFDTNTAKVKAEKSKKENAG